MNTIVKKLYILVLFSFIMMLSSCYKEAPLEPSGKTTSYSVPQGKNSYDETIVSLYEKYGTCLLYKFSDKDTYWTPTGWKNGVLGRTDEGGHDGYLASQADEQYVPRQLELIKECWFDLYEDSFLKALLPVKVMLCSEVDSLAMDYIFDPEFAMIYVPVSVGAYYNYDNICVNFANESIMNFTQEDKDRFRSKINRVFVESIMNRVVTPTNEFSSLVDYSAVSNLWNNSDLWAIGTFNYGYEATAVRDWTYFMLMMVCYTEDFLTREPSPDYPEWDGSEAVWEGILNPVKDVNGLLKKRYDMVRNYFIDNYGMDLQTVGNTTVK